MNAINSRTTFDACMLGLLFCLVLAACNSVPGGTSIGVAGNTTNVTGQVLVPVGSNVSVGVTGSVNPQDPGNWSAGIVVVFKSAPSVEMLALLSHAQAKGQFGKDVGLIYTILRPSVASPSFIDCVLQAIKEGATIAPFNPAVVYIGE